MNLYTDKLFGVTRKMARRFYSDVDPVDHFIYPMLDSWPDRIEILRGELWDEVFILDNQNVTQDTKGN